jgi:NADH:ubiquinone oxidoreductase subunit 6 (subunit J)
MIVLGLIIAVMLVAAAVAMTLRNLIHSALLLTLNWVAIAVFYLWAGAEFVAFAQALIYVGAVSMIVLFAVLLTRHRREADAEFPIETMGRAAAGVVTAAVVAGVICGAIMSTSLSNDAPADVAPTVTVRQIGEQLMGPQAVVALLVIGVLLTVALIGAVVIAAPDRQEGGE